MVAQFPISDPRPRAEVFSRFRLDRLLGLAFFVAGLCQYRSYENRQVFGLWSYPFFVVIVAAGALLAVVLVRSLLVPSPANPGSHFTRSAAMKFVDLALLFWGVAYFLSANDSAVNGARVLDLNFFGSVMPAAALLEWIALVLLLLGVGGNAIARLSGKWAKAGLVFGAILVFTLVSEGIARVKVAVAPVTEGFPTYSSEIWARRYVRLNRKGWRDAEHSISRDPGIRRLLVVGDSFAFGWGIPHVEDRLGEQLAARLERKTGARWEPLNASRGDSHTLDEIGFMERMAVYKPDVVLLIYVFNDIDYLAPVTRRASLFDQSFLARLYPQWLLYRNSYLFQELFVRLRLIYYRVRGEDRPDPYEDVSLLSRHLADLARFVAIASQTGATVRVVPFDVTIGVDHKARGRYLEFVQQARAYGISICSLEKGFDGFAYRSLTVNGLDGHPNETANRLAADEVADCLTTKSGG